MLKQGFVQEKVNDLAMTHYPHLMNNYPQWSRVNTLDKARYPKPFVKDKIQPSMEMKRDADEEDGSLEMNDQLNPAQRAQYLERSLVFLKRQHQDVLRSLHEEIDALKRENKDLQFRIVMSQKQSRPTRSEKKMESKEENNLDKDSSSDSLQSKMEEESVRSREEKLDEIKVVFLEEEIKELKHALRETRNRNTYLTQLLEQSEEQRKRQQAAVENMKAQINQGGEVGPSSQLGEPSPPSINLLQKGSRPLTLAESHGVIRHLQQQNEQQAHELESLKSDLRDVLYSHKWTPDAYLLAKAYIAEDDMKDGSGQDSHSKSALPRIPFKHPTRKLPDIAYIQRDNVTLPALKQTVSNRAMERRKRTQILQKARMRNEVLP
ncbi:coiled-coil domain-containing protein 74B-like [Haliotis asinina]|uniref:coiled-coil domain-containing protein 74B-like n=1 Tax=Haliotis asinina TaxID=109174 RepID=UPI003531B98E